MNVKTFEQILQGNPPAIYNPLGAFTTKEIGFILSAMKQVHDQAVEMCAESATVNQVWEDSGYWGYIDKQSILNVKD